MALRPVPSELPDDPAWPTPLGLAARRLSDFQLFEDPEQFRAIPRYEITAELAAVGCKGVLVADTLPALEELCQGERMKRSRVAAARHE